MPKQPPEEDSIWVGLFLGFTCVVLSLLLGAFIPWGILAVGLTQLVFQGPLVVYFHKAEKTKTMMGVVIIACLTILLNASCWGLVYIAR